jgi:hypothetical protein
MKNEPIKINYSIGHYWPDGQGIGTYTVHNSEVMYGTIKESEETLKYVKAKSPEENWRIFQLVQLLHDK